jgi:hypothetical protein
VTPALAPRAAHPLRTASRALHRIVLVKDVALKVDDDVKVFRLRDVQKDSFRRSTGIERLVVLVLADRVPWEDDQRAVVPVHGDEIDAAAALPRLAAHEHRKLFRCPFVHYQSPVTALFIGIAAKTRPVWSRIDTAQAPLGDRPEQVICEVLSVLACILYGANG